MPDRTATGQLREQVRERYAAAAVTVTSGQGTASCCDDDCGEGVAGVPFDASTTKRLNVLHGPAPPRV